MPVRLTVEINREMPYVFGKENGVHVSEVDFIIEGDDQYQYSGLHDRGQEFHHALGQPGRQAYGRRAKGDRRCLKASYIRCLAAHGGRRMAHCPAETSAREGLLGDEFSIAR
jgi:hypothetical protein